MTNYRLTPLKNSEKNRQRIIEGTRKKMQMNEQKPKNKRWLPAAAFACFLLLTAFLAAPYVQQAFFQKQNFTIEKVVIPNVEYSSLINATYVDETNEIIYSTETGFYSYNVASKQQTLLIDTVEVGYVYQYLASKKWLVWSQPINDESRLHVLNRLTNEVKTVDVNHFYELEMNEDTILYIGFEEDKAYYYTLNLIDHSTRKVREDDAEGSSSKPDFEGSNLVISNKYKLDGQRITAFSVHDMTSYQDIANFMLPYEMAVNVLLENNTIYAYLWNDDGVLPVIGAIDVTTGAYKELKASVGIDGYATDGEHFAIAVTKGDSNSVELFELEGEELIRTSKLPTIHERLVEPRFTDAGTLVVNGEGADRAMYLIRFDEE